MKNSPCYQSAVENGRQIVYLLEPALEAHKAL